MDIAKNEKLLIQDEIAMLPTYVQKLIAKTDGFERLFLRWNSKFLYTYMIDYLPDFEKVEDKGNPYWVGKMKWRYVGWNNNTRYTGADLREIRKQKGVGNYKRIRKNAEKNNESLSG